MIYQKKSASMIAYTRPITEDYADGLAYSVHFACSRDEVSFEALNHNYGILFAKATVDEQNVLHPKGVRKPWLFHMADGGFGIVAVRVEEDGSADKENLGQILLWTTVDFITFQEIRLLPLHQDTSIEQVQCTYLAEEGCYLLLWKDYDGNCYRQKASNLLHLNGLTEAQPDNTVSMHSSRQPLNDACEGNSVSVSSSVCDRATLYWSKLYSTKVDVPEQVSVKGASDIQAVQATVIYSDGSTVQKPIAWELDNVDFKKPGSYTVHGTVQNEEYQFPLAIGYGDPIVFPWEGRYYFIATDDNRNDVGFYIREADDVAGLFCADTEQHLILGFDEARGFVQTFWAPEFHVIGGELYLLFAISGKEWSPQCHLMKLKKGAKLTEASSWEEPIRIQKQDGSWLGESGITLDMTYLEAGASSYVVWSYREKIRTPYDTGSMLYIATIDPNAPWKLTSAPVLLSRPLYGWENVKGTINNEGPYALIANDTVYLTYSGGSAMSYTYALGLLTADTSADLLDLASWSKRTTPVLSYYSVDGEFGPGHNSFFTDAQGNLMIAYHAEDALDHVIRCDGIRRIHFNLQNEPIFDLSKERDLCPELSKVQMCVTIV